MPSVENKDKAMESLQEKFIETRYIEVHLSSPEEWTRVLSRKTKKHSVPINQNSFVLLLRGLPFSAHEDDCLEFFNPIPCLGVHLTKDSSGRPSGQGYAEFENKEHFDQALGYHKKNMQNRYIELFESSISELVENVNGRKNEDRFSTSHQTIHYHQSSGYTTSVPSQHGNKPSCIKMRGLPYNTREEDITQFFRRQEVTPSRIHRKKDGAEAFVEFSNPADANLAMELNKAFMGKRYVELFRVDYEEMAGQIGILPPAPYHPPGGYGAPRGGYQGGYNNYGRGGQRGRPRGRGRGARYAPYGPGPNRW